MKIVAIVLLFCLVSSSVLNSTNLTFTGCTLSDLKNEQLQAVTEVYALHCNIPEVENAVFLRHSHLTVLDISDSKLSILYDFALNGLKGLKTLVLARNNISEVKSWSNSDLTSVSSLDLRRNVIKQIDEKSFTRFPNLQKLNLAVNLIESIPYGVLRSMSHLKYINIGKNFLKQIDFYTFRGLHKLSTLALHYNQIETINPKAFDTNNHLRSLRLEANNLSDLEFMAHMNLGRLVHLNLSNNAIDSLERLAFAEDYELKLLDVSFNLIEEIYNDTLSGLESLETFNASHNRINRIAAKTFLELTSLTHLDISANNLTHLPVDIFNASHHLRYLNMSDNTLQHLDFNHFNGVDQLQVLDLSINRLHRDNFIEGLLGHHHSPVSLQLDLSNNMYSVLNLSLLYEFARVDLSSNLWDCKWLIQEMIRGPATIQFGRNYTTKDKANVLSVPGVDCYDGETKRSIIVLIGGWNTGRKVEVANGMSTFFWSKMHSNRFDDKEIVIWMLIALIVGFILVRTIQIVMTRWLSKTKQRTSQPITDRELEKMEMVSYGDETESVASTLDVPCERGAKPKELK